MEKERLTRSPGDDAPERPLRHIQGARTLLLPHFDQLTHALWRMRDSLTEPDRAWIKDRLDHLRNACLK